MREIWLIVGDGRGAEEIGIEVSLIQPGDDVVGVARVQGRQMSGVKSSQAPVGDPVAECMLGRRIALPAGAENGDGLGDRPHDPLPLGRGGGDEDHAIGALQSRDRAVGIGGVGQPDRGRGETKFAVSRLQAAVGVSDQIVQRRQRRGFLAKSVADPADDRWSAGPSAQGPQNSKGNMEAADGQDEVRRESPRLP